MVGETIDGILRWTNLKNESKEYLAKSQAWGGPPWPPQFCFVQSSLPTGRVSREFEIHQAQISVTKRPVNESSEENFKLCRTKISFIAGIVLVSY